ncbi:MAG TPA: FAD-binding oxidoreductase [Terriglobales bacterium]|nr:FAD-binding oxidoreductase [Terriglobales bacterium]
MLDEKKYWRAEITYRRDLSPDLWIVRARLPAPFPFRPGQYATLALEDEGGIHERPYSIVSGPHESELEFFLELVPQGEVTPLLYRLQPGDAVWVRRAAKGLFQLDRKSGHGRHLMVATVTGLAPFLSMLRTFAADRAQAEHHRFLLLAAASRSWEFGYREELLRLAAQLPSLTPVFAISRCWEDTAWTGERGRAEDLVRKYADAAGFVAGETTAYLCGHPGMIANVKGILTRAGFEKKAIREEIYWIPGKAGA